MAPNDNQPTSDAAGEQRGVRDVTMRRALHDLSGPLNTIAMLCEVLRGRLEGAGASVGASEVIDRIVAAVHGMAGMIGNVREVAASMPAVRGATREPVRAALSRAAARAATVRTSAIECADELAVDAPRDLLDGLFDAAYRCCAQDATIRWRVTPEEREGDEGWLRVTLQQDDAAGAQFPPVTSRANLVVGGAVGPEWFVLTGLLEGLGGAFVSPQAPDGATVEMCLRRG